MLHYGSQVKMLALMQYEMLPGILRIIMSHSGGVAS